MFDYLHRKVETARATENVEAVGDCTLAMVIDAERQGVGQRMETKELCDELYNKQQTDTSSSAHPSANSQDTRSS